MTIDNLKKANAIKGKIDEIDKLFNLSKSKNSTIEFKATGSESNMGTNYTRSISFSWGSELGVKMQELIKAHQSDLKIEFDKI